MSSHVVVPGQGTHSVAMGQKADRAVEHAFSDTLRGPTNLVSSFDAGGLLTHTATGKRSPWLDSVGFSPKLRAAKTIRQANFEQA